MKIIKQYSTKDVKDLKQNIILNHGDAEKLKQRAYRSGCRNPDLVDDHVLYTVLNKNATYHHEHISRSAKSISALTPRRVELLAYLYKNDMESIMDLANGLMRNYKNVYDDLKALEENDIISLIRRGKNIKPVLNADRLVIDFG